MREMKDSGIEWVGIIPKSWNISRLKYIAKFFNGDRGKNYPSGEDLVDDGIAFLTSNNIHGIVLDCSQEKSKFITEERYNRLGGAKIQLNDIAFCLRGSVGNCAINKTLTKGTVASSLMIIRPIKASPDFINYVLQTDVCDVQTIKAMNGSCAANLSAENVSNYYFVEPPIAEQKKITIFLDSKCSEIDAISADIQKEIKTLEQYKRSVITEAVTKGLNPDAEMKDSGIEWVGNIPVHWDVRPLYYYFAERKKKNYLGQEQNLLSLSYGKVIRKDINTSEGLLPDSFNGYNIIEPGDIVLRLTDLQNDKRSLRTGLVKEHGIITSAYVTLKAAKEVVPEYFHYLLHAYDVMKVLYNMGNGVRQGLNYSELSKMHIVAPPIDEQKNIAAYLDAKCKEIESIIESKKQQLTVIDSYKKSLIYEYVTGKKEVI
ncbi:MAG: restriction endonuclease subunit S [Subdoligranulum sp.]|jgi:type I restriction enzyme S subunit